MENHHLASENFSSGRKNYFIDFKKAANDSQYICITRSDLRQDGIYHRSNVVIFEEDFHFLISALSSLFHSAAHLHQDGRMIAPIKRADMAIVSKGIKSWEEALRPREKFISLGSDQMSDAELVAILIGSGRPNMNAVDLSQNILNAVGGRLDRLALMDLKLLSGFKGIGPAKSSSILAALELGRRMCAV